MGYPHGTDGYRACLWRLFTPFITCRPQPAGGQQRTGQHHLAKPLLQQLFWLFPFATSGLLQTGPALAVMLGADVGSTLVVQVLPLIFPGCLLPLILLGVTLFLSTETRQPRVSWAVLSSDLA